MGYSFDSPTRSKITEVLRTMPDLTANEIYELVDGPGIYGVKSCLYEMKIAGLAEVSKRERVGPGRGRRSINVYRLAGAPPASTPPQASPVRPAVVKVSKPPQPTVNGLQARLDQAHATICELQAWKAAAIARYPDLAVDPVVLEARKLLAAEYPSDRHLADEIMQGRKDTSPAMRALVSVLKGSSVA